MELRDLYRKYARSVIGLETEDGDQNRSMGTAFHIGDGFYLTARHVIEDRYITDVVFQQETPTFDVISGVRFHRDPSVDLALLSTFSLSGDAGSVEAISLGFHINEAINDSLVLRSVLMMGFPRVPHSLGPALLAVTGEVNAVVHRMHQNHPFFVVSSTARGGFSGGPVLADGEWLVGVVTDALTRELEEGQYWEPGFAVALTVQPIFELLLDAKVAPRKNRTLCYLLRGDRPVNHITDLLSDEENLAFREYEVQRYGGSPVSVGRPSPAISNDGFPIWDPRYKDEPALFDEVVPSRLVTADLACLP